MSSLSYRSRGVPAIRPCSEYPNANTALHAGAIFGCDEPTTAWRVVVAASAPAATRVERLDERTAPGESGFFACAAAADDLDDGELPDVAEFEAFSTELASSHELPQEGFARVVQVLERLALELVGTDGPNRVQAALSGKVALPPAIAFALLHWRALLEGDEHAALPELTLDEWATGFLTALCGAASHDLRARVRNEGIAAFGVLDAA